MGEEFLKVVVNHEGQYSIWPADRENPLGWNDAGFTGSKEECLARVKEVWTDRTPLSLGRKMSAGGHPSKGRPPSFPGSPPPRGWSRRSGARGPVSRPTRPAPAALGRGRPTPANAA